MRQWPTVRVRVEMPGSSSESTYSAPFRIGRAIECGLRIVDDFVSRQHAEVVFENGEWWIRDLGSTNGILAGGVRVPQARIETGLRLRLGSGGPFLAFELVAPPPIAPEPAKNLDSYIERYFSESASGEPVGEHTMMIRKAFSQVQKTETLKHKRKYGSIIAVLGVAVAAIAAYAGYIHYQTKDQIQLARDLFYSMKAMDVEIAQLERLVDDSANAEGRKRALEQRKRRTEITKSYDKFLDAIRARDKNLTEPQRLIVRVARIFGE
ncbi:MAG: FHA domain-containing protein [Bryobacteraceae bacterium]